MWIRAESVYLLTSSTAECSKNTTRSRNVASQSIVCWADGITLEFERFGGYKASTLHLEHHTTSSNAPLWSIVESLSYSSERINYPTMVNFVKSALAAALIGTAVCTPITPRQDIQPSPTAGGGVSPTDPAKIKELQTALLLSPGFADRQSVLLPNPPDASNITFQFHNNTVTGGTGGTIALTTLETFPALIGTNVAAAVGFVNACGLNVPHNHPRANELLTVVSGKLIGGLILEQNPGGAGNVVGQPKPVNGPLQQVNATLENFKAMLFPQGETHFQFNPTCEPALFTAAFDSSDPGRTQIARNFFSAYPDEEVLIAAVGGNLETLDPARIGQFRNQIPTAFAVQIESCVKRCRIPQR